MVKSHQVVGLGGSGGRCSERVVAAGEGEGRVSASFSVQAVTCWAMVSWWSYAAGAGRQLARTPRPRLLTPRRLLLHRGTYCCRDEAGSYRGVGGSAAE